MGVYVCPQCMKEYHLKDSGVHSCVSICVVCQNIKGDWNQKWCNYTRDIASADKCSISIPEQILALADNKEKITKRLTNVNHQPTLLGIVLKSRNIDRLRSFYELLGVKFVEEKHGKGPLHFAGILPSNILLELYPTEDHIDTTTRLSFSIVGIEEVITLAKVVGELVHPIKDTTYGRKGVLKDPDGRTVELIEKVLSVASP